MPSKPDVYIFLLRWRNVYSWNSFVFISCYATLATIIQYTLQIFISFLKISTYKFKHTKFNCKINNIIPVCKCFTLFNTIHTAINIQYLSNCFRNYLCYVIYIILHQKSWAFIFLKFREEKRNYRVTGHKKRKSWNISDIKRPDSSQNFLSST